MVHWLPSRSLSLTLKRVKAHPGLESPVSLDPFHVSPSPAVLRPTEPGAPKGDAREGASRENRTDLPLAGEIEGEEEGVKSANRSESSENMEVVEEDGEKVARVGCGKGKGKKSLEEKKERERKNRGGKETRLMILRDDLPRSCHPRLKQSCCSS